MNCWSQGELDECRRPVQNLIESAASSSSRGASTSKALQRAVRIRKDERQYFSGGQYKLSLHWRPVRVGRRRLRLERNVVGADVLRAFDLWPPRAGRRLERSSPGRRQTDGHRYGDDILTFSKTRELHPVHLRTVIETLQHPRLCVPGALRNHRMTSAINTKPLPTRSPPSRSPTRTTAPTPRRRPTTNARPPSTPPCPRHSRTCLRCPPTPLRRQRPTGGSL